MAPLVSMVINCLICFGLVLSSGIGTLVQCRFDRIISFFSNRSVKSILKNAPKRREREEDEQMMELDPLEPEDEGVLSILLCLKLYSNLSLLALFCIKKARFHPVFDNFRKALLYLRKCLETFANVDFLRKIFGFGLLSFGIR